MSKEHVIGEVLTAIQEIIAAVKNQQPDEDVEEIDEPGSFVTKLDKVSKISLLLFIKNLLMLDNFYLTHQISLNSPTAKNNDYKYVYTMVIVDKQLNCTGKFFKNFFFKNSSLHVLVKIIDMSLYHTFRVIHV